MGNKNLLTWAALVMLTTASFLFYEGIGGLLILSFLLMATLVKIGLVAYQFMELKKAHVAWTLMLGFVIVVYAGAILVLSY